MTLQAGHIFLFFLVNSFGFFQTSALVWPAGNHITSVWLPKQPQGSCLQGFLPRAKLFSSLPWEALGLFLFPFASFKTWCDFPLPEPNYHLWKQITPDRWAWWVGSHLRGHGWGKQYSLAREDNGTRVEELAGATGERKMMVKIKKGVIDHWKHTDAELKEKKIGVAILGCWYEKQTWSWKEKNCARHGWLAHYWKVCKALF